MAIQSNRWSRPGTSRVPARPVQPISARDGSLNAGDGSLRVSRWDAVCGIIARLEKAGFFCVGGAFDFEEPPFLWRVLTYCYAEEFFGSQRILSWMSRPDALRSELNGRIVRASDLRGFRRNNRKVLTLSLEEATREFTPAPVQRARAACGISSADFAELSVREAIRFDLGETDV